MPSPLVILASLSVVVGILGSVFIFLAISVDSWEEIDFSAFNMTNSSTLEITPATSRSDVTVYKELASGTNYFLYYQYGGPWKLCDLLTDSARETIASLEAQSRDRCYNFVSEYDEESSTLQSDGKSIARLQNSGASCFIVCIIDLVAALGVGVIALLHKHVTACMVTGVLYCMASLFTVFGLAIFHVKHHYELYYCQSLYPIPKNSCDFRTVTIMWAVPVAWVGVVICSAASFLWLFLTRALRVIKAKTMI
ncbi:uncharacterized protein LOC111117919 [Crassostrea virginica]